MQPDCHFMWRFVKADWTLLGDIQGTNDRSLNEPASPRHDLHFCTVPLRTLKIEQHKTRHTTENRYIANQAIDAVEGMSNHGKASRPVFHISRRKEDAQTFPIP